MAFQECLSPGACRARPSERQERQGSQTRQNITAPTTHRLQHRYGAPRGPHLQRVLHTTLRAPLCDASKLHYCC
jgi:hypothetical protein